MEDDLLPYFNLGLPYSQYVQKTEYILAALHLSIITASTTLTAWGGLLDFGNRSFEQHHCHANVLRRSRKGLIKVKPLPLRN